MPRVESNAAQAAGGAGDSTANTAQYSTITTTYSPTTFVPEKTVKNKKGKQTQALTADNISPPMVKESYPAIKTSQNNTDKNYQASSLDVLGATGYNPQYKGVFISDPNYVSQYNSTLGVTEKDLRFNYAFRFLYNPTSVSMGYSIMSGFDPGLILSGQDPTSLITPIEGSSITFELILNRVNDMKYLDKNGIKKEFDTASKYPYPTKITKDQAKLIYNKGTMSDVEYLLAVVNGYKMNTAFRGKTADYGYLSGTPFLVKLGDGLKYSVYITNLQINHGMFDRRMVPVLTTVTVTLTRYVDNDQTSPSTTGTSKKPKSNKPDAKKTAQAAKAKKAAQEKEAANHRAGERDNTSYITTFILDTTNGLRPTRPIVTIRPPQPVRSRVTGRGD